MNVHAPTQASRLLALKSEGDRRHQMRQARLLRAVIDRLDALRPEISQAAGSDRPETRIREVLGFVEVVGPRLAGFILSEQAVADLCEALSDSCAPGDRPGDNRTGEDRAAALIEAIDAVIALRGYLDGFELLVDLKLD